jgi:TatD DNase family protein
VTGSTVAISQAALELARAHPGVLYATAGVHPHHAKTCDAHTVPALRALAAADEVVAIGECGLDFYRDLSPRPVQEEWLRAHIALAAELRMPLFLHERDAAAPMAEILRETRASFSRGVVHCFTGDAAALRAYLDLDLHIGITGWICDERRGLHLRELVRAIPADRLMLETDAPYLLPRTIPDRPKSRRNEPANLVHVLAMVAECRGVPAAEVATSTTRTAAEFFGLPA